MTLSLLQISVDQAGLLEYVLPFEHEPNRQRRYVLKRFPILRWSSGLPWFEANAWLVSRAGNIPLNELSLSTLQSDGYALLEFMRFLEGEKLPWNYLPIISADRAINRYRGHLITRREEGDLSPSTTTSRMAVALRLYRWASHAGLLGGQSFEKISKRVRNVRDRLGNLAKIPTSFSNLAIPNNTRKTDVVEGGLVPLETSERDQLINFAEASASLELVLILKLAFFTGMRIGSICDLKVKTLEWAYADADKRLYWINIGPNVKGAPVRTKKSVNGRVLISKDLLEELKSYSASMRRLLRENKAHSTDKGLLFLNRYGRSYGRDDGMQSSQVCGLISKLKQKAAKAGLDISDFHIHRARATFGTNMMVAGLKLVPNIQVSSVIAFVRDIMLHKDEAVTMTYVRFVESRKIKSAFADGYTKMLIGTFLDAA